MVRSHYHRPGGKVLKKQGKKGRPRSENPMVHTAVVLPRDLLERLRTDAERSERGLSTEIRQRLQTAYGQEGMPSDPETTALVHFIKNLSDNLAADLGKKWHESTYALAAFTGGVLTFLGKYAPENGAGARDIPGHSDSPEAVGRTHARLIIQRAGEKNE
jgi:Arc-like DNA binding domain